MSAAGGGGRLTTHVLDASLGVPAEGLALTLRDETGAVIVEAVTNDDGRCDAPLLAGADLKAGRYELTFHAGPYLKRTRPDLAEPLFLEDVPIRFGVADPGAHYHVPLLLSPFSYSTYRGS